MPTEEVAGSTSISGNMGAPTNAGGKLTGECLEQPVVRSRPDNNNNTGGQTEAPDFMQITRKATVATAMSSEGSKYVKILKEYLEDKNSLQHKVNVQTLSYPPEALVITAKNVAQVLLFSEAWHRSDVLPTIAGVKEAVQSLQSIFGRSVKMINCIVVSPHDYQKAETMGASLLNSFTARLSNEIHALTIDSLKKYDIEIMTNSSNYDNFVNRYNPHGVPSLAPLTIVVYLTKKKRPNPHDNLFLQAENDRIEIGSIGAYVNFTRSQNQIKFTPEVHISELTAPLPFTGILTLLISIATHILLDNGYWMTQFNDIGPGKPNIGNLLYNPATGEVLRSDNVFMNRSYIETYCHKPALILDLVEGRYRIPGIEQFITPTGSADLIRVFNAFLGSSPTKISQNPDIKIGKLFARSYIGTIGHNGVPFDSRWVSYLNMMIHHASDPNIQQLLEHPRRPEDVANFVRSYFRDYTSLYMNQEVTLIPEVIREIQNSISAANIRISTGTMDSGYLDPSILINLGNAFATTQNTVGYYSNSSQPFDLIYGANGMQGGNIFS